MMENQALGTGAIFDLLKYIFIKMDFFIQNLHMCRSKWHFPIWEIMYIFRDMSKNFLTKRTEHPV